MRFLQILFVVVVAMVAVPRTALALTVGIVDIERALAESNKGRELSSELESLYNTRQAEFQRRGAELEQEAKQFEAKAAMMSESAAQEAYQAIVAKEQQLMVDAQQAEAELQQKQIEGMAPLAEGMQAVIQEIAREQQVDIVMDRQVVIYAGSEIKDLTRLAVERFNRR